MRNITKILLTIIAVVLISYDFIPFYNNIVGDTISEVIKDYALRYLTLPLVFGTLMGHFFAPVNDAKQYPKILLSILISSLCIDLVNHIYFQYCIYPFIPFLIGLPIGMNLWQQRRPHV